jgi:hypothetical protein
MILDNLGNANKLGNLRSGNEAGEFEDEQPLADRDRPGVARVVQVVSTL